MIVAGFEKLVSECSSTLDSSDRKFNLEFAKMSSILVDFCDFFSAKNERPSALLVFSRIFPNCERFVSDKLKHWYSEYWNLKGTQISCHSSKQIHSVNFFLKDNQYYLASVISQCQ